MVINQIECIILQLKIILSNCMLNHYQITILRLLNYKKQKIIKLILIEFIINDTL